MCVLQLSNKDHAKDVPQWIKKTEVTKKVDASAVSALTKKGILIEAQFEIGRLLFEKGNSILKE